MANGSRIHTTTTLPAHISEQKMQKFIVIKEVTASILTRLHWDQQQAWHHTPLDPLVLGMTDRCKTHEPINNTKSKASECTVSSNVKGVLSTNFILVAVFQVTLGDPVPRGDHG